MQVLFGADEIVKAWVANQLGYSGFSGPVHNAFGVADSSGLVGGTVFHNHYPKEGVVEMTSASTDPRWLTRRMIRTIFNYAFEVLECQMVVMRISANNSRMLNIGRRFGFVEYTIPRLRGKNEDEVIMTFCDDQWLASPFRRRANGQT